MDLGRVAVAGQRANQSLEQQGRRDRGHAELPGGRERCRRRHDQRAAAGGSGGGFRCRGARARPCPHLRRLRHSAVLSPQDMGGLLAAPTPAERPAPGRRRHRYLVVGAGELATPLAIMAQARTGHDANAITAHEGGAGPLNDRMMMAVAMFLRPFSSLLLAALLAVAVLSPTLAKAQERDVDFDLIYAELEPYGTWFEHPAWGTVWRPRVDAEWRPYAHGSWLYTDDYGWYWQAEEPWGWAPFHYGRWLIDEDGSWIWIPDSEWGPAWVAWRWSDDYVGWAPLPPQAVWGADGELAFDPAVLSAPAFLAVWCFVRPHQLILPGIHRFFVARRQAHAIFRSTRALPGPRKYEGRFINTGFDVKRFEHMTGRPVVRLRLRSVDSPQAAERGRGGGPEIAVFKPRFSERAEGGRIHRPAAVDRGPPPAMADPGAAAGRPLAPKSEIPSTAPGQ